MHQSFGNVGDLDGKILGANISHSWDIITSIRDVSWSKYLCMVHVP
jgi:hypothetical protein